MRRNTFETVSICEINPENFGVSAQFLGEKKEKLSNRERIKLKDASVDSQLAETLIQQFGTLYLISQNFPQIISAPNLEFHDGLVRMIDAMYEHYGYSSPTLEADRFNGKIIDPSNFKISSDRAAVLYSGGKDSMWVYCKLADELGDENVTPIHIKGLNKSVAIPEWNAVLNQAKKIGFNLQYVDLLNSSKVFGKAVMNARDFLMMSLALPQAFSFGASRMLTEGGMLDNKNNRNYGFASGSYSWKLYSDVLEEMGIPIRPDWYKGDTDFLSMRDLYIENPEWMPLVSNCFTPIYRRNGSRSRWEKNMPNFKFYPDQCGSCIKCRSVGLARLLWDKSLKSLPVEQALFMIKDNEKWVIKNKSDYADMGVMSEFEHWIAEAEKIWFFS